MLNENKTQFQEEQNKLLKTVLNLRFFEPWKESSSSSLAIRNDANLELFITADCNQQCQYCYLIRHEALYPKEYRNQKTILNNLKLLYEYCIKNDFHIPCLDIFTGEIWHTQFGLQILELTFNYMQKGLNIDYTIIASNCSFINDDVATANIQNYIYAFKKLGHPLIFSCSVDGLILDQESRPRNDQSIKYTEDFYDKLFSFCVANEFYFHPMVSSKNVHAWIKNFQWFEQKFKENQLDVWKNLMMLEVRNPDWTNESINDYNNFMNYLIDEYYEKKCHSDIKLFTNILFNFRQKNNKKEYSLCDYTPWAITECDNFIGCTASQNLTIRLGDLAICPCHRTSYNKYLYGKFIIENNEITDIQAENPQMAINVLMTNFNYGMHGCNYCLYRDYCLKGCFGAQTEELKDPFMPIPNICNFFKKKYDNIWKKYEQIGVIDYLDTFSPLEQDYEVAKKILNWYQQWKEEKINVGEY